MGKLTKANLPLIIGRVQNALQGFPQVAGAYLFGSILGPCRPDSDIDLGLVLEPETVPDTPAGERLEAAIALQLSPVDGHPFDVFLLDPRKPLLAFRVIKEGRLVYARNPERVLDVVEQVSRRYADLYPRYRAALEEIIAEVTTGGLRP